MKNTQNYAVWQKKRVNFFYYTYKAYKVTTTKKLKDYRLVLLELLVLLITS